MAGENINAQDSFGGNGEGKEGYEEEDGKVIHGGNWSREGFNEYRNKRETVRKQST